MRGVDCMYAQPVILEGFIKREREFIRFYVIFALSLIAAGIVIIGGATFLFGARMPDLFKTLIGLGGGLVATLSSFPVKEVLNRRDRISLMTLLEQRLAVAPPGSNDDTMLRQQLDGVMSKMVEKTLVG